MSNHQGPMGEIIIIGAGGLGRLCADVAEAAGLVVHGFADSNHELGDTINGHQCVANTIEDLQQHCKPGIVKLFVAIGDNDLRGQIYKKTVQIGFEVPVLIHPSAIISRHAKIESGTAIMPNAVVNANARVGHCCILGTGSIVDYDVVLEDSVSLSPDTSIAGGVTIGSQTFVGTGANVIPNVSIGRSCLIGCGAAVTKDVKDGERMAGVPARPVKR